MSLTLEQARMNTAYSATWSYAFTRTDGQRVLNPDNCKSWKSQVMAFGTNVQRCGLLQGLAFLRRDKPDVYHAVVQALADHLCERGFIAANANDDLMAIVRILPSSDYMLVSREVLGVALWLKRAAQILCAEPPARGAPAGDGHA